jgi:predicted MFS family arabinose efflux permease
LGIFAGFFILTIFPEDLGWRLSFLGFTALMAVGAYLAVRFVPETKSDSLDPVTTSPSLSRSLISLLLIVFITGASEAMLGPIYLIFLQDRFTTDIPLLVVAFLPGGLVTAFFAGRLGSLSDRFGRTSMLALGLFGSAVFSLLLPSTPTLAWLIILYTLATVAWNISEPAEAGLVADWTGQAARGQGFGLYELSGLLGATLGPLIGGLVYDALSPTAPFYLNGVILLGGVFWVGMVLRRQTKEVLRT